MTFSPHAQQLSAPDYALIERESGLQTANAIRNLFLLQGANSFPVPWNSIASNAATPWDTNYFTIWENTGTSNPNLGNGVTAGGHMQIGTTHFWYAAINIGTTTTFGDAAGTWTFTAPVNPGAGLLQGYIIPAASGIPSYFSYGLFIGSGTKFQLYVDRAAAAWGPGAPLALGNGDKIRIFGWMRE